MKHSWEIAIHSKATNYAEIVDGSITRIRSSDDHLNDPNSICRPYVIEQSAVFAHMLNYTLVTASFYDYLVFYAEHQDRIYIFTSKVADPILLKSRLEGIIENTKDALWTPASGILTILDRDPMAELVFRIHDEQAMKVTRYADMTATPEHLIDLDFITMHRLNLLSDYPEGVDVSVMDYKSKLNEHHSTTSDEGHLTDIVFVEDQSTVGDAKVKTLCLSDEIAFLSQKTPEAIAEFERYKALVISTSNKITEDNLRNYNKRKALQAHKLKKITKKRKASKAAKKSRKKNRK